MDTHLQDVLSFQPASCNSHTPLGDVAFRGRPTVVTLFIHKDAVLLTQPAKVLRDGVTKTWGFPQGGVDFEKDRSLHDTILRENNEELNFEERYVLKGTGPKLLGQCLNPIPPERKEGYTAKHLFFFAVLVWSRDWVRPKSEVRQYKWVTSWPYLESLMGAMCETRPVKVQATRRALLQAREEGLLNWQGEPALA